jgi:hypothetical protein
MVVVGAGQAGGRAALTPRAVGQRGRVVLLGSETAAPYERPPLSKAFLKGERTAETFTLATRAALAEGGIDFRPATTAKLLLATGRAPRHLPLARGLEDVVHVLRDLSDAEALRAVLVPGARLAIVGGGFIGLEAAASARARGADATGVEILPRLLSRCVPCAIAARLERRHAASGVELTLDRRIEQMVPSTSPPVRIRGARACSGSNPGRTPRSRGRAPRATCWAPPSAARSCPGYGRTSTRLSLQIAGHPELGAHAGERPFGDQSLPLFHLGDDGGILGLSGLGPTSLAKEFKVARLMAERGLAPDPAVLSDPTTRLKALLR